MKRVALMFLLLSGLVIVSSCSKNDPPIEELNVTVNGVDITFNTIIVDRQTSSERYFSAIINSNTSRIITFSSNINELGDNSVQNFTYTVRGKIFRQIQNTDELIVEVSTNTNARFTMEFSGTLSAFDPETESFETINLTDGSMDIVY